MIHEVEFLVSREMQRVIKRAGPHTFQHAFHLINHVDSSFINLLFYMAGNNEIRRAPVI